MSYCPSCSTLPTASTAATQPAEPPAPPELDLSLEPLAAELYDTFYRAVGGVTYDHNPLPDWFSFRRNAEKNPKLFPRFAAWFAIAAKVADVAKKRA